MHPVILAEKLDAHAQMGLRFLQTHAGIVAVTVLVVAATVVLLSMTSGGSSKKKRKGPLALDSERYQPFKLVEKEKLSHDTRRFRFALQSPEHVLGLPIGKHISLKFTDKDGKEVSRSYTPVSSDNDLGYVDFVIKVYFAGVHPKFPEGGKMSQHLESLALGDSILMMGPKGKLEYAGRGTFEIKSRGQTEVRKCKELGMIAGGTGITPMLQVLRAILKDPKDKTVVRLIFANQTEEDILLRQELEDIAKEHPARFKLHYTLDRPPANWAHSSGFINAKMVAAHLPPPHPSTQILVCGPPPMIKFACEPAFKEVGFNENQWFAF